MGEPGGLSSMGSHRVGHDRCNLAAAAELKCSLFYTHTHTHTHTYTHKCSHIQICEVTDMLIN